jgi:hypothetical protein
VDADLVLFPDLIVEAAVGWKGTGALAVKVGWERDGFINC